MAFNLAAHMAPVPRSQQRLADFGRWSTGSSGHLKKSNCAGPIGGRYYVDGVRRHT